METPTPKREMPKREMPKPGQLFALASALFALAGLVDLFVRQWAPAAMFLALGFLYGALAWRASRKQGKP